LLANTSWQSRLTEFIEEKCEAWRVPGLCLAVARHGEVVYVKNYGYRDVEQKLPVTTETVFGIASVTKSFTALATMQLLDEGRLSIDDPLSAWLPELSLPQGSEDLITIHHLLTHTSGLPGLDAVFRMRIPSLRRDGDIALLGTDMPDVWSHAPIATFEELLAVMSASEYHLLAKPGERFNYSNEGYALMQGVIERASGQKVLDYMQTHLIHPLGMKRAAWRTAELSAFEDVTELYGSHSVDGKTEVFHSSAWWDVGNVFTNGSLKTSAEDLLRYLEVYRGLGQVAETRVVSDWGIQRMMTPYITLPTGSRYGYGLFMDNHHGTTVVGHGGGIKGVSSDILVANELGLTVVVLCNLANVPVSALTTAVVNAVQGLPLDTPTIEYPQVTILEPVNWAELVGDYRSAEGESATVQRDAEGLIVNIGEEVLRMRPYAKDGFVSISGGRPVCFLRNHHGEVDGLFLGVRVLPKLRI
jgi:CubicO group peptidase (beta-lactamase class C family)